MTTPDDDPVLPDVTTDERDTGWGDESVDDDQQLIDDRPPHHEDRG